MREKDPLRPPTPTWSWTAFEGPIDYLDTPPRWEVKWNSAITLTIAQNSTELTAPVMPLKVEGTHRGNSKHLQVIPDSVHPLRTHELSCVSLLAMQRVTMKWVALKTRSRSVMSLWCSGHLHRTDTPSTAE